MNGTMAVPAARVTCTATDDGIVAVMVVTRTHVTTTEMTPAARMVTVNRGGGRIWSSPARRSASAFRSC